MDGKLRRFLKMATISYRRKNGQLFYPQLGSGYDSYGYGVNREIKESEHPLPYSEDILSYNGTRDGAEIVIGKFRIEEDSSPYMERPFVKMYDDYSESKKIVYNVNTDEIIIDDEVDKMLFNHDTISEHRDWLDIMMKFVYYVAMHRNPYVYCLFSEYTSKTKKMSLSTIQRENAIFNIWKHIDNLNNFEKVVKSIGEEFIFDNIGREDFSLNNAKKLHQVVEMPLVVAQGIKKLGVEDKFADMKTIAGVDKNYAITLIDFIFDYKKAFPGKDYCSKADVSMFITNVSKLMELGIYNNGFNELLNFIVNENLNYSSFHLPVREAGELVDYWKIANGMIEQNGSVKFERFPRNIQKAHNVIMQNSSIISNPRPEEFAAAIAKQAFLNDEKDEEYVFMVPRNEMDLLNEGNALQHCVASYRDRIIDDNTKVVLMRKKDDIETPFVTIEYDSGMAVQVKEMFNADVEDADVLAAVNRWLVRAERRESK